MCSDEIWSHETKWIIVKMSICQVVTQTTTYFPAATVQHCSFCCSMIVIYSVIRSCVQCFCNIDAVFTHIYPSYTNNRYWLTYACWGYQWIIDLLISLLEPSITLTQTQMQKLELMKETLIVWLLFKNGFTFQITMLCCQKSGKLLEIIPPGWTLLLTQKLKQIDENICKKIYLKKKSDCCIKLSCDFNTFNF